MIAGAALLVPVRLIQEANPDWRLLSWSMALAVIAISAGGLYLAGGLRWVRHFAFPMLFFLVAVPWPTQFEQAVIQGLMRAVASINVEVLNAIGISAVQMGNVIEVGSGFVGIAEACTGVRSLQSTFMVSLFLGEFYQFSVLRRVMLVIAGAILAFVCNLIRTFLLVYVAEREGMDAIHSWHDPAGLTILLACLFGLWGLSMLMGGSSSVAPTIGAAHARGALPIPRVVLICLLALTVTAEAATQAWYGFHEARAARVEPWNVAWPKEAKNWKEVPVSPEAQELLRYNEGGGGSWIGEDGRPWTMYFFKWLPGRTAGLFIKNHRPDVCLPASGMTLRSGVQNKLFEVNGVMLADPLLRLRKRPDAAARLLLLLGWQPAGKRAAGSGKLDRRRTHGGCEARQARRRHADARDRRVGLRDRKSKPSNLCASSSRGLSSAANALAIPARAGSAFRVVVWNDDAPRPLSPFLSARSLPPQHALKRPPRARATRRLHQRSLLEYRVVSRQTAERLHGRETRQIKAVHADIARLGADVIGFEEMRDFESAALAVQPLAGFKVDVCSNFPPREGQDDAQQVAIASRLQPISAWAEELESR